MITFVPTGGLANKMRATLSIIQLSQEHKCNLQIYWIKSRICNCYFSDIFDAFDIQDVNLESISFSLSKAHLYYDEKRNFYIPWLLRKFTFDKQFINLNKKRSESIRKNDSINENIYINSCGRFYDNNTLKIKDIFKPKADIQKRINATTQNFDNNTIGIHIRRTDNIKSIKNSPVSMFIEKAENELNKTPNCKIYLATDDLGVKKMFIQKFPEKILYNKTPLKRNSLDGMIGAVIDLWCLSKTSKIYGSSHSSFSGMASIIGDKPLIVLKDQEPV